MMTRKPVQVQDYEKDKEQEEKEFRPRAGLILKPPRGPQSAFLSLALVEGFLKAIDIPNIGRNGKELGVSS
jgi:hypothetical protein